MISCTGTINTIITCCHRGPGAPGNFVILRANTHIFQQFSYRKTYNLKENLLIFVREPQKNPGVAELSQCFTWGGDGRVKSVAELSQFFTLLKTAKWPS